MRAYAGNPDFLHKRKRNGAMNRLTSLLNGIAVGAGAMYLFDPVVGNRRRSLLRDQMNHLFHQSADAADATLRDVKNRTYGYMAQMRGCMTSDDASDAVVTERVRSKLGRHVSHPSAIEVSTHDGVVCLCGPVLAHEVNDLLCAVRSIRGVEDVDVQLDIHDERGNVPALQGGQSRTGEPFEYMQANWSPAARLLAGAAGTRLMLNCLSRRGPLSLLLGTAGFALTIRALTNTELKRSMGIAGGRRGVDVQKTVEIDQPVEDVYAFLSDPTNYPRITNMVKSVEEIGDDCYRKTMAGPAGTELVVEERITRREPNHFIACRSEPNSPLRYAMRVWFEPVAEARTRVHIQATYNPPGGALTHAAASVAGLDLKSQLDDTLMRAKAYLETGQQPHDAAQRMVAGHHSGRRREETHAGGSSTV
jgi:uncharacterized membrane protein